MRVGVHGVGFPHAVSEERYSSGELVSPHRRIRALLDLVCSDAFVQTKAKSVVEL